MKRLTYIIIIGMTFYLAGYYQSNLLMILCLALVGFLFLMYVQVQYFRKSIDVFLQLNETYKRKNATLQGKVIVKNKSVLPISFFQVEVECYYKDAKFQKNQILRGYVGGKSTKEIAFQIEGKYSGLAFIEAWEVTVKDYFSFFHRSKNINKLEDAAILPSRDRLDTSIISSKTEAILTELILEKKGRDTNEILQIQTYEEGDDLRDIHWKLSAKQEELLRKEYTSSQGVSFSIFVNMEKDVYQNIEQFDAYMEVIGSISQRLVDEQELHQICWYDHKENIIQKKLIKNVQDYDEAMVELIKSEGYEITDHISEKIYELTSECIKEGQVVFSLNEEFKLLVNEEEMLGFKPPISKETKKKKSRKNKNYKDIVWKEKESKVVEKKQPKFFGILLIVAYVLGVVGTIRQIPAEIYAQDIRKIIVYALIALLLFLFMFVLKKGWIFGLAIVAFILAAPVLGIQVGIFEIACLALYHAGSLMVAKMGKESAGKGVLFLGIVFCALFFMVRWASRDYMRILLDTPVQMEQEVRRVTNDIRNQIFPTEEDHGKINRGNNYPSNTKQLEVSVSKEPKETIYLKNFVGKNYANDHWSPGEDRDFYEAVAKEEGNSLYQIWDYYGNIQYYYLAYNEMYESKKWTMTINTMGNEQIGYVFPYISKFFATSGKDNKYHVYDEADYLKAIKQKSTVNTTWFEQMEQRYQSYVKNNYLSVAKEKYPRLTKLCEKYPEKSVHNISKRIIKTLHERTTYTLTPGITPVGEEVPEYFLFESKEGYCQQYATTAVLMYRMYGVPARYITGYAATKEMFQQDKNGLFKADLLESNAHAWVEIYIKGQGWIPVEVTPSSSGNSANEEEKERLQSTSQDKDEPNKAISRKTKEETSKDFSSTLYILSVVILIIFVIVGIKTWRNKKLVKREEQPVGDYGADLVHMLHLSNYMKEYAGVEEDFVKETIKEVPQIDEEAYKEMMKIIYKATFGNQEISEEEKELVKETYKIIVCMLYERLKIHKKLYAKFIGVYL